MISAVKTGLTAMGAIASLGLAGAPVAGAMSMDSMSGGGSDLHIYETTLNPLNNSGAHGKAVVVAQDGKAFVAIKSYGLSVGLPHAEHIHLGSMPGTCPTPSADKNGDGLISVAEAAPNYGPIKVSLTTSGDVSADSALAVDRFPVTAADGSTTYVREFDLPAGVTAANLKNGEIVQHGISTLFGDPTKYDGSTPSSIAPNLPIEATIPADCGTFTEITPMVMSASQYPTMFNDSISQATANLHMALGNDETVSSQFTAAYTAATTQFESDLMVAASNYADMSMTNGDVARDQYVDAFNHAKSDYFGNLEAARNSVVDHLSGVNDVAKDQFVNAYNQARDTYGNQLEMVKNQF